MRRRAASAARRSRSCGVLPRPWGRGIILLSCYGRPVFREWSSFVVTGFSFARSNQASFGELAGRGFRALAGGSVGLLCGLLGLSDGGEEASQRFFG